MDDDVRDIKRTVGDIYNIVRSMDDELNTLRQALDDIKREVGAKEGRQLSVQINELEQKISLMDRNVTEIQREAQATRKLAEYGDTRMQEIMKALALIYRNTDDLEQNLVEAENIRTSE